MTIGITGATGQVGKELTHIFEKSNIDYRALTRQKYRLDFDRPETFHNALKGLSRLFLICPSFREDYLKDLLSEVKRAGVSQIVLMSGYGVEKSEGNFLANVERCVRESNIPYVALRANWFFQNFGSHFKEMITNWHELRFPDGGKPLSFIDARDIAEVAFHFLNSPISSNEELVSLTGPESLTHLEVAKLFSKHLPYQVGYRELTEAETGWGEGWLALFRDVRQEITAPVSDGVEKILQKAPRDLESYIKENQKIWR